MERDHSYEERSLVETREMENTRERSTCLETLLISFGVSWTSKCEFVDVFLLNLARTDEQLLFYSKTDFPDIMSKCLIHSRNSGSIMVIPREDGLVRLYVQLQAEAGPDGKQKHYGRDASEDICKERARKIFEPFKLEFGKTAWFSVYRKLSSLHPRYSRRM